jgi:hypothetical protein
VNVVADRRLVLVLIFVLSLTCATISVFAQEGDVADLIVTDRISGRIDASVNQSSGGWTAFGFLSDAKTNNGSIKTPRIALLSSENVEKGQAAGRKFARAAIIAFGAFPLSLLYADFAFDIVRFASNGFDTGYAPWPFKSQYSVEPDSTEKAWRLMSAALLSVTVSALDALLAPREGNQGNP